MSNENTPYALVVDDDGLIRMHAMDILEDAGFRVLGAANAEEALLVLQKHGEDIQLLFTDVQMPPGELNGFHLARRRLPAKAVNKVIDVVSMTWLWTLLTSDKRRGPRLSCAQGMVQQGDIKPETGRMQKEVWLVDLRPDGGKFHL
ncbi:response regulator [Agrobacterium sp. BA1120]|uniref:response regulator n=1 Tax=Agrobacterium sp. BA1120 TaxID=3228927 RepID=UPI003369E54D